MPRLSATEAAELQRLELTIQSAATWAVEEAQALLRIRNRRLYRATHANFFKYASERWGYEHSHVNRLCQWAEVLQNVAPIGDTYPLRESHARPLYGLRPEQQREAWKLYTRRRRGKDTAREIEGAVRQVLRRAQPRATATPMLDGEVVVADAIDGVQSLMDGSVHLLLSSPPYTEQRHGYYPGIREKDYPQWMMRLMAVLAPKMAEGGSALIIAREHMRDGQISDVWLRSRLAIRSIGWRECETMIWIAPDKPPLGNNHRPRRTFEYVYWFSMSGDPYVDLRACGNAMQETPARMRRPRGNPLSHTTEMFARMRGGTARVTDVITAPVGGIPARIDHPAMFPPSLAEQLIKTFCPVGGLVADFCCGSGTTLLAARNVGRRWWGCDVLPKYVRLARRRLCEPVLDRPEIKRNA